MWQPYNIADHLGAFEYSLFPKLRSHSLQKTCIWAYYQDPGVSHYLEFSVAPHKSFSSDTGLTLLLITVFHPLQQPMVLSPLFDWYYCFARLWFQVMTVQTHSIKQKNHLFAHSNDQGPFPTLEAWNIERSVDQNKIEVKDDVHLCIMGSLQSIVGYGSALKRYNWPYWLMLKQCRRISLCFGTL